MQPGTQTKNLRVTAQRAFQLVQRDDNGEISGRRIVKPGEVVSVERMLGLELIATAKAVEGGTEAPAATRSNRSA